jgi:hypothetical protein
MHGNSCLAAIRMLLYSQGRRLLYQEEENTTTAK